MSFNRENIIWQSADGTWSRGFYEAVPTGDTGSDDYDPEWDVEYLSTFDWVSTGHPTQDAAWRSWTDSNPGGGTVMAYDAKVERIVADAADLDKRAAECKAAQAAARPHRPAFWL